MVLLSHPYYVYILKCSDGSLYTGITTDLEKRLLQHNGKRWGGARYTSARRPVELVYHEKYPTRTEAAQREWAIKHTFSRSQKEELIVTSKSL